MVESGRYLIKRILEKAGLREIRFHDIRHSYASLLFSDGASPVYVKEQLGHSSIQITVDIYGPHRGVSEKHLQRYLTEVCYRFNRRFWERQSFHRLLNACASTDTITRNELMAKTAEQSQ